MNGVRARLVLWNVIVIGLILAAMGFALRYRLQANLHAQIDAELRQDMSRVSTGPIPPWDEPTQGRGVLGNEKIVTRVQHHEIEENSAKLVQVVKQDGGHASLRTEFPFPVLIPVGRDRKLVPDPMKPYDEVGFSAAVGGKTLLHEYSRGRLHFRSISEPVRSGGRIIAVAQATRDLSPVESQLHQLDLSLMTLFPLALIVAAAAGTLLVGSTMRPLRRLTDSARGLDPELANSRLPFVGADEFAELAKAFNEAFDRTSAAFATQQRAMKQLERFTGDAGHELRTPLGAIKGSVSFLLHRQRWNSETRTSLDIIDSASDRMERLIQDLLLLARNDGGACVDSVPIPVAAVVDEAVKRINKPANLNLQVCIGAELAGLGDGEQLTRVVMNLLSNAYSYTRGRVSITASATGDWVEVTVEDNGEGIAPEHVAKLGERFYRPNTNRPRQSGGTGLGLAIAKSIVEAHGGTLEIQSQLGIGTKAIVRLRAASPTQAMALECVSVSI